MSIQPYCPCGYPLRIAIHATNQRTRLLIEEILRTEAGQTCGIISDETTAEVDILDADIAPFAQFMADYRENPERPKIVIAAQPGGLKNAYFLSRPIRPALFLSILRKLSAAPTALYDTAGRDYCHDSGSFAARRQYFQANQM